MHGSEDAKAKILHRFRIAKGHLDKVLSMIEGNDYCVDIALQSKAVQNALREGNAALLENHLRTCVVDHIKKGEIEKTVEEMMKVFKGK